MKTVDIDNIFYKHTGAHPNSRIYAAFKEACEQTVELCAENYMINKNYTVESNKQSILNTKNQIV